MPGRLKGIQVSREYGTPFLAATQVFDVRPVARKWLSLEKTSDVKNRFVAPGTILVTCSGSVGRPTLAYGPLEKTLISHDLLRIDPLEERNKGWVYAYLHSPQTRAMAVGTHYGHIIKPVHNLLYDSSCQETKMYPEGMPAFVSTRIELTKPNPRYWQRSTQAGAVFPQVPFVEGQSIERPVLNLFGYWRRDHVCVCHSV